MNIRIRAEVWALIFIALGVALTMAASHFGSADDLRKMAATIFALGLVVWQRDAGGPTPPRPTQPDQTG
jgi:hypothetical protein